MEMKVLVTGASGFVGGWLVKYLIQQGLEVRVLDRSQKISDELKHLKIETVMGDILNPQTLSSAMEGVDSVFHLAGLIAYTRSQRQQMDRVNVLGTQNIIEACIEKNVRRLVHFSSVVAVGASFDGKTLLNENSEYNIHHLNLGYFESKFYAEQKVKQAVAENKIDAVIVNPATIYGPGDAKKGSRGVQLKVARGKIPFYPPGGVNIISIEDIVSATFQAWKVGRTGERYILSNENILIKDLFNLIATAAGVEPPKIGLPKSALLALGRVGDILEKINLKGPVNSENAWASILFHWYDNSKAKQYLGLNPKPAKYAIEQSLAWIKEQGML
jgi:dihydroflavonol-4-reductase